MDFISQTKNSVITFSLFSVLNSTSIKEFQPIISPAAIQPTNRSRRATNAGSHVVTNKALEIKTEARKTRRNKKWKQQKLDASETRKTKLEITKNWRNKNKSSSNKKQKQQHLEETKIRRNNKN